MYKYIVRRHPLPEIMDEQCLSALQSVENQYGGTVSHGAGLEVRLGSPERYTDYILNIDTDAVPGVPSLWHEIDYQEFRKANGKGERMLNVGEKIRELRTERKMSQDELSKASGVNRTTISMIETDKVESVTTGTIAAIAEALGVSVRIFFE